jgi:hypothetical protein
MQRQSLIESVFKRHLAVQHLELLMSHIIIVVAKSRNTF